MVFDLELDLDAAAPGEPAVTPGVVQIGAGSATEPGWFSTINDGISMNPRQNAAFTSILNIDQRGPLGGRVVDDRGHGGPDASLAVYPSATGWPANANVPQGLLVGMGACYTFWNNATGATGIGRIRSESSASPICLEDGDLPLFEGQINTTGLPAGSYRLVLVPRSGNIQSNDLSCTAGSEPGYAEVATTVNGDTIAINLTK